MSKKKPMDKTQLRERRNRLLAAAAAAELSLIEGVREMRAIADMTQEEFARHRGVSARVIKALELGQGNPTVATLNRIGQFFGLEVAFVPIQRVPMAEIQQQAETVEPSSAQSIRVEDMQKAMQELQEHFEASKRMWSEALSRLDAAAGKAEARPGTAKGAANSSSKNIVAGAAPRTKRKPGRP